MIQGKSFKYFLLEEGDIVNKGDEYYNPRVNKWIKVSDGELDNNDESYPDAIIGYKYLPSEMNPIRRKNKNLPHDSR